MSIGSRGHIQKVVKFKRVRDHIFNLVFGDWDEMNERIDDKVITNNGDREKVLATVADIVIQFIDLYPSAFIFAQGSTASRTRLYQIGINANLPLISQYLYIEGFLDGQWQPFIKGKNYNAFLVCARKIM